MNTVALVPVKELKFAKARLASFLDEDGRRELAIAMLRDLLDAARACGSLDRIAVVSRDDDVLRVARDAGADALPEPGDLNAALESAVSRAARDGAHRIVVLAADLPMATAEAIGRVTGAPEAVALAPSGDGGTNALALAPGAIAFQFGPESARKHLAEAERAGLAARALDIPELTLDIDTRDDLTRFAELSVKAGAGAHTRAALVRIGFVAERSR